jgi:SagB-type dehydrogenase family enzyme
MTCTYATSPSLVVVPSETGGQFHVYDFLTKAVGTYESATLYWLSYFKHAKTWEQTVTDHAAYPFETLWVEFETLCQDGFIKRVDDTANDRHDQFRKQWAWDLSSGIFHFTVMDSPFATSDESTELQLAKQSYQRSPELTWRSSSEAVNLPFAKAEETVSILKTMMNRRTNRTSAKYALNSSELGTSLFAGLGITAYTHTQTGKLPLGMTPSGGARNPYEAYVIVNRGQDLKQGIYRYNPNEHNLDPLGLGMPESLAELAGNQDWIDGMSVVVILVAYLERTMWKYPDPNAYRVVLIEAGHIVQNIMLAATSMGLTVCPTAALAHSQISETLGLTEITQTPVYMFTLDRALTYPDPIQPNPLLQKVFAQDVLNFAQQPELVQ